MMLSGVILFTCLVIFFLISIHPHHCHDAIISHIKKSVYYRLIFNKSLFTFRQLLESQPFVIQSDSCSSETFFIHRHIKGVTIVMVLSYICIMHLAYKYLELIKLLTVGFITYYSSRGWLEVIFVRIKATFRL